MMRYSNYMYRDIKRQNPVNKLPSKGDIEAILRDHGLDLPVNDLSVYHIAFIHKSYLKPRYSKEANDPRCVPLQNKCNETYEYLGDTILSSVIGTYLYDRFYNENEGFLTKTRTKMVRGTTLGELARRIGLNKWIIISQHVESEGGRQNLRILEDLFEAFIGAIYLDNGGDPITDNWISTYKRYNELAHQIRTEKTDRCDRNTVIELLNLTDTLFSSRRNGYIFSQKFIMRAYEKHIDIVKLISYDDNYKDQLQHYFQKVGDCFPTWEVIREDGKTNNRWHTIGVRDRFGNLIGIGEERKKTDAEQLASKNALIHMGQINADHGVDFFYTQ